MSDKKEIKGGRHIGSDITAFTFRNGNKNLPFVLRDNKGNPLSEKEMKKLGY